MLTLAINDSNLAWIYMDPEYQASDAGRRLLEWVARLMGPAAWAVIQTSSDDSRSLYECAGFRIVSELDAPWDRPAPLQTHLAQTL